MLAAKRPGVESTGSVGTAWCSKEAGELCQARPNQDEEGELVSSPKTRECQAIMSYLQQLLERLPRRLVCLIDPPLLRPEIEFRTNDSAAPQVPRAAG